MNLRSVNLSGSNPYSASNLGWNVSVPPGQAVEFGFQGSYSAAEIPQLTGSTCH